MIKKMSIVDVMFGINQKINNYYLAKLAVSSFYILTPQKRIKQ